MRLAFCVFSIIASTLSAQAADIKIRSLGAGAPDLIVVYGKLEQSDADQFNTVANATSKALVAFAGPGGNVVEALAIGETIRLKNFATVVLDHERCASACALAWLGGTRRFMGDGALIGFHATWDARSGSVSGVGNALVGAYLNKLGLPTTAVVYITAAAPAEILWLTISDAKRYGIDVSVLKSQANQDQVPTSNEPSTQKSPMERAAIDFLLQHTAAESDSPASSMEKVRTHYADTVFYYGKYASKTAVLEEYETFLKRWPRQIYQVRPDSIAVQCFPGSKVCNLTALIDWVAVSRARGKRSEGYSTWSLSVLRRGNSFVITSINGEVRSRRITDISNDPVAIQK